MAETVLETPRLLLRRIGAGDAALQFAHLNSPAMMAHLGGPKTLEDIAERHARTMRLFDERHFGFLMMIEKASGDLVGHCGIKLVDHPLATNPGDHEIGWAVREDRWRRGYANEAMRAVIDWAFAEHNAPHLVALTSLANVPSWRLMEKLGMERASALDFTDPAYPQHENPTIVYRLQRGARGNSHQ